MSEENALAYLTETFHPLTESEEAMAEHDPNGKNPHEAGAKMDAGKVPVFRAGNVLIIHDTQALDIATPAAGEVINTGRQNLAIAEIVDATGNALDPAQYTVDLAAGTVTMANPLVLQDATAQALAPPLVLNHRIEESSLCSDVSLDGTLELAMPLERDIPATALVSSAIAVGDMQARANNLFSQVSMASGVFSDTPTGAATNGRFNDLDYPIILDGRAKIERTNQE